ncbi:hypothetical protein FPZ43_13165 [Mucilaginibacter pallidiroseus]|uniref:Outer membrane protein assembly factor BamE n=1 Tax=Mucilaginibacter pallidiroseus TaxID=2599295 RepID=A0A563U7W4_9SPHI|nr:hypothetical protein [Mucilaginibacter pallidiroseus]TWR27426.1 hypothetical protein FPZ43_13165 [Mucilaginibacter pallidiroseus]
MEVYFIVLLLAVPFYLIFRYFLKDKIKSKNVRIICTIVATIIAAPIFYILVAVALIMNYESYPNRNFDKEAWLNNKNHRYEYSEDIIQDKLLIGKTKKEVQAFLGKEGNLEADDTWYYDLGYKPGLGNIDPDVLMVEFVNGVAVKVSQYNT